MWTAAFWKATAERAVKTFAQSVLALLVVGAGFADLDWATIASVSGVAALASVLTSIVSGYVGERGSPSLGGETLQYQPRHAAPESRTVYSSDQKSDAAWHPNDGPDA